jgi:ketosteroid isomerase-like protein
MASDRLETVRRLADAVNRADKKAAFACMTPGVIWNATGEIELPDQKLHYNGRDEVWGYLRSLEQAFGPVHVDVDSIEEVGNLVVARVHLRSAGRAGSAEADLVFSSVARFKEGRIAKVENYVDHDEAMNDAELRAQE